MKRPRPTVYERLAEDLPINAVVVPAIVDDPYGLEKGDQIKVLRSTRDDPLARMRHKGIIQDCELAAGRLWQRYHEQSEIGGGVKGIDTTREAVDGGRMRDPLSAQQMKASDALREADQALGAYDKQLVRDILGSRVGLAEAAQQRHLTGLRGINYMGRRFRDALDTLARLWGLRT